VNKKNRFKDYQNILKMSSVEKKLFPQCFYINDIAYYNVDDLRDYNREYFKGCVRLPKQIVDRKKISSDKYIFATHSKKCNTWSQVENTTKLPKKCNLLLTKTWVDTEFKCTEPNMIAPKIKITLRKAPPLIELTDDQKFKNDSNEVIEIETRGTLSEDGIYFLCNDVADVLKIDCLSKILFNENGGYIRGTHYKTFCRKVMTGGQEKNRKGLYITYQGMIKILFSSHSEKAKLFQSWATNILYTHHMGTKDEKQDLASNLLGVSTDNLRNVLNCAGNKISCVYSFSLGTVQKLRKQMAIPDNIPDDNIVIKYGFSKDLMRRTTEHIRDFKTLKGTSMELLYFCYLDTKKKSEAETRLKNFMSDDYSVNYMGKIEIVVIPPKRLKVLKDYFETLHIKYSGTAKKLNMEIQQLQADKSHIQYKLDVECEAHKKTIEHQRTKDKLHDVEIEIRDLKLQVVHTRLKELEKNIPLSNVLND
jgi:hypothetical protein